MMKSFHTDFILFGHCVHTYVYIQSERGVRDRTKYMYTCMYGCIPHILARDSRSIKLCLSVYVNTPILALIEASNNKIRLKVFLPPEQIKFISNGICLVMIFKPPQWAIS